MKKLEDNGFKLTEFNESRYLCHSCYSNMIVNPVNKRKWKKKKHTTIKRIKRTVNQSYSISDHNVNSKTMVLNKYMLVPKGEYKKLVSQKEINQLRQDLSQVKEEMQILQTKLVMRNQDSEKFKNVLYDPDDFITMLNNYNPNLKSFFNAMVKMTSPKEKNSDVNKCRIVGICYEFAGMHAGISLMTMGLSKQGIDALATLDITASYRVIAAKRCKLLKARDSDLEIYFQNQLKYAHFLNIDDYHDIHEK
ncbi:19163_t:CDS:2 [Cetraspora pellucida]|uniref:19163_t:CDS:1 n=1 Tax=Cetraspora pellucida TaxID=1433469 RepID=A0A9N9P2L6_9GLOM|nr:19163_t:CDS:2 [Cetraspora pellucida]